MTAHYHRLAFTPNIKAEQTAHGSRAHYEKYEGAPDQPDPITDAEADFIAARDSFYMATVGETGWPYMQHRGGPPGFVRVLDAHTLGMADFRGNRQYITLGNIAHDNRTSLFFMDYANKRRLKALARITRRDLSEDAALAEKLALPGYRAKVEHALIFTIEAFEWNCPAHITPRWSEAEIGPGIRDLHTQIALLQAELKRLQG